MTKAVPNVKRERERQTERQRRTERERKGNGRRE